MRRLLTEMMGGYLEELEGQAQQYLEVPMLSRMPGSDNLPVAPRKEKWTHDRDQRCLTRRYEFESHPHMCDFIRELLRHETECSHYGKILCDFPSVTVSVKTHDVDDVTELDRDYASQCDSIYNDVLHYTYNEAEDEIY